MTLTSMMELNKEVLSVAVDDEIPSTASPEPTIFVNNWVKKRCPCPVGLDVAHRGQVLALAADEGLVSFLSDNVEHQAIFLRDDVILKAHSREEEDAPLSELITKGMAVRVLKVLHAEASTIRRGLCLQATIELCPGLTQARITHLYGRGDCGYLRYEGNPFLFRVDQVFFDKRPAELRDLPHPVLTIGQAVRITYTEFMKPAPHINSNGEPIAFVALQVKTSKVGLPVTFCCLEHETHIDALGRPRPHVGASLTPPSSVDSLRPSTSPSESSSEGQTAKPWENRCLLVPNPLPAEPQRSTFHAPRATRADLTSNLPRDRWLTNRRPRAASADPVPTGPKYPAAHRERNTWEAEDSVWPAVDRAHGKSAFPVPTVPKYPAAQREPYSREAEDSVWPAVDRANGKSAVHRARVYRARRPDVPGREHVDIVPQQTQSSPKTMVWSQEEPVFWLKDQSNHEERRNSFDSVQAACPGPDVVPRVPPPSRAVKRMTFEAKTGTVISVGRDLNEMNLVSLMLSTEFVVAGFYLKYLSLDRCRLAPAEFEWAQAHLRPNMQVQVLSLSEVESWFNSSVGFFAEVDISRREMDMRSRPESAPAPSAVNYAQVVVGESQRRDCSPRAASKERRSPLDQRRATNNDHVRSAAIQKIWTEKRILPANQRKYERDLVTTVNTATQVEVQDPVEKEAAPKAREFPVLDGKVFDGVVETLSVSRHSGVAAFGDGFKASFLVKSINNGRQVVPKTQYKSFMKARMPIALKIVRFAPVLRDAVQYEATADIVLAHKKESVVFEAGEYVGTVTQLHANLQPQQPKFVDVIVEGKIVHVEVTVRDVFVDGERMKKSVLPLGFCFINMTVNISHLKKKGQRVTGRVRFTSSELGSFNRCRQDARVAESGTDVPEGLPSEGLPSEGLPFEGEAPRAGGATERVEETSAAASDSSVSTSVKKQGGKEEASGGDLNNKPRAVGDEIVSDSSFSTPIKKQRRKVGASGGDVNNKPSASGGEIVSDRFVSTVVKKQRGKKVASDRDFADKPSAVSAGIVGGSAKSKPQAFETRHVGVIIDVHELNAGQVLPRLVMATIADKEEIVFIDSNEVRVEGTPLAASPTKFQFRVGTHVHVSQVRPHDQDDVSLQASVQLTEPDLRLLTFLEHLSVSEQNKMLAWAYHRANRDSVLESYRERAKVTLRLCELQDRAVGVERPAARTEDEDDEAEDNDCLGATDVLGVVRRVGSPGCEVRFTVHAREVGALFLKGKVTIDGRKLTRKEILYGDFLRVGMMVRVVSVCTLNMAGLKYLASVDVPQLSVLEVETCRKVQGVKENDEPFKIAESGDDGKKAMLSKKKEKSPKMPTKMQLGWGSVKCSSDENSTLDPSETSANESKKKKRKRTQKSAEPGTPSAAGAKPSLFTFGAIPKQAGPKLTFQPASAQPATGLYHHDGMKPIKSGVPHEVKLPGTVGGHVERNSNIFTVHFLLDGVAETAIFYKHRVKTCGRKMQIAVLDGMDLPAGLEVTVTSMATFTGGYEGYKYLVTVDLEPRKGVAKDAGKKAANEKPQKQQVVKATAAMERQIRLCLAKNEKALQAKNEQAKNEQAKNEQALNAKQPSKAPTQPEAFKDRFTVPNSQTPPKLAGELRPSEEIKTRGANAVPGEAGVSPAPEQRADDHNYFRSAIESVALGEPVRLDLQKAEGETVFVGRVKDEAQAIEQLDANTRPHGRDFELQFSSKELVVYDDRAGDDKVVALIVEKILADNRGDGVKACAAIDAIMAGLKRSRRGAVESTAASEVETCDRHDFETYDDEIVSPSCLSKVLHIANDSATRVNYIVMREGVVDLTQDPRPAAEAPVLPTPSVSQGGVEGETELGVQRSAAGGEGRTERWKRTEEMIAVMDGLMQGYSKDEVDSHGMDAEKCPLESETPVECVKGNPSEDDATVVNGGEELEDCKTNNLHDLSGNGVIPATNGTEIGHLDGTDRTESVSVHASKTVDADQALGTAAADSVTETVARDRNAQESSLDVATANLERIAARIVCSLNDFDKRQDAGNVDAILEQVFGDLTGVETEGADKIFCGNLRVSASFTTGVLNCVHDIFENESNLAIDINQFYRTIGEHAVVSSLIFTESIQQAVSVVRARSECTDAGRAVHFISLEDVVRESANIFARTIATLIKHKESIAVGFEDRVVEVYDNNAHAGDKDVETKSRRAERVPEALAIEGVDAADDTSRLEVLEPAVSPAASANVGPSFSAANVAAMVARMELLERALEHYERRGNVDESPPPAEGKQLG